MKHKILFAIIALAIFTRFYALTTFPEALSSNEALLAWRGSLLAGSFRDETGQLLPVFFVEWKSFQLPAASYLIAILSPISYLYSPRLLYAITSLFLVYGIYILVNQITKNRIIAVWTSFIFTISPWTIWLSRSLSPELLALTFWVWALIFKNKKKPVLYVLITLLAIATSPVFWWFYILFILFSIIFKVKDTTKKIYYFIPVLLILILIWEIGVNWVISNQFGRIFEQEIITSINQMRGLIHPVLGKIFLNKSLLAVNFVINSLNHLSPYFLFAKEGHDLSKGLYSSAPLLLVFLPFLIQGSKKIFAHPTDHSSRFIIVFTISSVIAATIYGAPFNFANSIFLSIPLTILIAKSLSAIKDTKKIYAVVFLAIFNLVVVTYMVVYSEKDPRSYIWQPENIALVDALEEPYKQGKNIWITDALNPNIGPLLALYYKSEPKDTNLYNHTKTSTAWINRINNMTIGNKENLEQKVPYDYFVITSKDEDLTDCNAQREKINATAYVLIKNPCIRQR